MGNVHWFNRPNSNVFENMYHVHTIILLNFLASVISDIFANFDFKKKADKIIVPFQSHR